MCRPKLSLSPQSNADKAVSEERRKVLSGDTDGDVLVMHALTKAYKKSLAVNQLYLTVKKGEVRQALCNEKHFL